ncbi:MAG: nucleotidyltransferase family protein, partial [Nitrososphaerales archaeon]
MKAVILAGGSGTRLYPLTRKTAKCMLPVNGKPLLEHIIGYLAGYGFKEIIVTLGTKKEQIIDYFGDGSEFNVNLSYSVERKPLGTAGSLKNAEAYLSGRTLIMQGDNLTNFNLRNVIAFHRKRKAMVTITLTQVKDQSGYGIVVIDRQGRIMRFEEKPRRFFSKLVNSGIYVVEHEVLDHIPKGIKFDFSSDLFPKLLRSKLPVYGIQLKGYWFDIGTPARYRNANRYLKTLEH